ncbi:Snf7-domain-containing protein [Xylariaceae sp. FL0255]|nr:Snf7-domain-containing protein [Xylariaceae sp. FL0255]
MSDLLDYLVKNDSNFRKARLPALYSDFRSQRTLNPDGYAANIAAWKNALSDAAIAGRIPSKSSATTNHLTIELDDSLLRALENKQYGRPLALGAVLQDAITSSEMIPLSKFQSATQSIYHKSWGSIPWAVTGWAFRKIGLGGPGDSFPKGQQVVVIRNLEYMATAFGRLLANFTSPFERTFSRTDFRRVFETSIIPPKGQRYSDADLDIFIKYLSRDKGMIATDGNTIKIKSGQESDSISEEDSAIASLKELMEDLTQQTEVLSRRVDELNAAAQDAVRRKNRISALAALKSKKLAENNLATRHATLNQLEEVASKIQQASDNVQLVRVMESSTGVLRSLNAQVGGADRVDEVLDNLREQMGEVDEVGNVIAEATSPNVVIDEGEVDDEFEAMLAEEQRKEEEVERKEKEAKEAREAEETRQKLAELEKLGPVPAAVEQTKSQEAETDRRPITPVTAAANELESMNINTEVDKPQAEEEQPEKIPA